MWFIDVKVYWIVTWQFIIISIVTRLAIISTVCQNSNQSFLSTSYAKKQLCCARMVTSSEWNRFYEFCSSPNLLLSHISVYIIMALVQQRMSKHLTKWNIPVFKHYDNGLHLCSIFFSNACVITVILAYEYIIGFSHKTETKACFILGTHSSSTVWCMTLMVAKVFIFKR